MINDILLEETVNKVANSRYKEMSVQARRRLMQLVEPIKIKKGKIFMPVGKVCENLYLIGKGLLRQVYTKEGKDITEHFSYEGCLVFSLESTIQGKPNAIFAEALEDLKMYKLTYQDLLELTEQDWEINMFYRKVLEFSLIVSQQKAYEWRFNTANEKYIKLLQTQPEVIKRAPLIHIASYLNITPETLSRVRASTL